MRLEPAILGQHSEGNAVAKKSKRISTSVREPNNTDFQNCISQLAELGLTQSAIANRVDLSAGQLSRINKGERPATVKHVRALRKLVRDLKKERSNKEATREHFTPSTSLLLNDNSHLGRLSPRGAIEVFRDLLWTRCTEHHLPITQVSISLHAETADGGVDASILEFQGTGVAKDELLAKGTRYQIKTGTSFSPWHPSQIKKELFGQKTPAFATLGKAVQQLLKDKGRFVLVCFGIDLIDSQIRASRKNLIDAFAKCGYPKANVEVWGQTQLVGLIRHYPSLCLRLMGHEQDVFRSHPSWSQDSQMQHTAHYSIEQQQLIIDLQYHLRCGDRPHLRLIGEPGVGKTRFALEVTRSPDLAPSVIYVPDARSFLKSSFVRELVRTDDQRFAILIVDECPNADRADIWNILKPRSNRLRLITIDHGPDTSVDDRTRLVELTPVGVHEITSILLDHDVDENDAKRWAGFCEGCPRVAHVLGENLRKKGDDLLQSPATVEVWNRFVVGYDHPDSADVAQRKIVLRHLALFDRFGFVDPVSQEAQFIAKLASKCDPRLTWPRFQEIVEDLRKRRILQGGSTLYITPRLLHVQLYRDFWNSHGNAFDIATELAEMPRTLNRWFIEMMRFAHECPAAERAVESLLGRNGLFPGDQFPEDEFRGEVINSLAEMNHERTLRCLERTIGSMSKDELCDLSRPRQSIVWALEKIAVRSEYFVRAAGLLLKLAESENANHSNNATGTFKQLFSLIPGLAVTQAAPEIRFVVLEHAINSSNEVIRRLGLEACETALSTSISSRTVGPEHQGLRKTIEFWMPKTQVELWEEYERVWNLLVSKLKTWRGEELKLLTNTIISGAWSLLEIQSLSKDVLRVLNLIADSPATDLGPLVSFVKRQLQHKSLNVTADTHEYLRALCNRLDGNDFVSRLRRFVKHLSWEDYYDEKMERTFAVEEMLDHLADEAMADLPKLMDELYWLVNSNSNTAYGLGFRLGRRDIERNLFRGILEKLSPHSKNNSTLFMSGYLGAVYERSVDEWEIILNSLVDDPRTSMQFSTFVISSGMSDNMAQLTLDHCRSGKQEPELLQDWWFSPRLQNLNRTTVEELLEFQMACCTAGLWSNAVHMCHTYFVNKDTPKSLPEDLVLRLLTHKSMTRGRICNSTPYHWSKVARAFLNEYPRRKWDFFRATLSTGTQEWSILSDLNANKEQVLVEILRDDPVNAFRYIVELYREVNEDGRFALQHWLRKESHRLPGNDSPGPIQYVPSSTLFEWVDANIGEHGRWLTGVLPRTLDQSTAGRLTRDFVAKYSHNSQIASALYLRFSSHSFWGKASNHYRMLREKAQLWLTGEKDMTVVQWVENYIDGLTDAIDRSEIDEERRW